MSTFQDELKARDLLALLRRLELLKEDEYRRLAYILIGRIDREMRYRDHGMPASANMPE